MMWGRNRQKGKILWTKRRPDDVPVGKFLILLWVLGIFGAHNFVVGRRVRGWIMLISTTLLIVNIFVFPHASATDIADTGHPWRYFFESNWFFPFFPLDIPGTLAILVWFVDLFAILIFNQYRYPIRIEAVEKIEDTKGEQSLVMCAKQDNGVEQSTRTEEPEDNMTVDELLAQRKKKPPPPPKKKQGGKRK